MNTLFRHYNALRLFVEVARHGSFTGAARELHMTKGAISYQITTLENQLKFDLFERNPRGVTPTSKGEFLLENCRSHFFELENVIAKLKDGMSETLTVGVSTYFAARWLSPKLMNFMEQYPHIKLRIQPMTQPFGFQQQGVDISIRWGNGDWTDADILPFMTMPSWPVGNSTAMSHVKRFGLKRTLDEYRLLGDHEDSNAWSDWIAMMGYEETIREDSLIIPDPNVRVQAVIDGQGLALMDDFISDELTRNQLFRLSDATLANYGYFVALPKKDIDKINIRAFIAWLQSEID